MAEKYSVQWETSRLVSALFGDEGGDVETISVYLRDAYEAGQRGARDVEMREELERLREVMRRRCDGCKHWVSRSGWCNHPDTDDDIGWAAHESCSRWERK